ncbi:MAG TPA: tetratricopeptide repeat protein [Thermoanaerobaculia bacterium]|nr:tetratricopeptide repeat protein [Thermoanaerobaculia bacterium]
MKQTLLALGAALVLAACAGTGAPPLVSQPQGEFRFLIDPRTGSTPAADPAVDRKFEAAWRYFLAGDDAEARKRLDALLAKDPSYLPAALAAAAVDIRHGELDTALAIVQRLEDRMPDYTAARIYEGEIAVAQHRLQAAYDIYRTLAQRPNAPAAVTERLKMIQDRLFEELFAQAQGAPDDQAVVLLREALTLNPGAANARILLASRLISQKAYEDARQALDPVINSAEAGKPEVQEALAEIEVGRGQYQQAMTRYDRLSRQTHDPRYARRLEQIKEVWNEANLPPQYQQAIGSEAIDRSDFAVLMYWTLNSVRFAQDLGSPPIAIDIEGVPGRDEMIRAMALGLYDVDPVTRRVSPNRLITAAALERLSARLLTLRGADCARGLPGDRVLQACGITDPVATLPPDSPVTGRTAEAMLEQIEKVLPK